MAKEYKKIEYLNGHKCAPPKEFAELKYRILRR